MKIFVAAAPAGTAAPDPVVVAGNEVVTTDVAGGYRVQILTLFSPTAPATVRVAVIPGAVDTIRTEAVGASLRSVREPADSLALDVVVP